MEVTIGIIGGKGKMGQLFARLFSQQGYKVLISDKNSKLKNKDLVNNSDIIIISVNIDQTIPVINEIEPYLNNQKLLMDLTSLKKEPIQAMLKTKARVLSIHPMFNDTSFGSGQKVLISKVRCQKTDVNRIKSFFHNYRVNTLDIDYKKHDDIMAIVQVLVHFAEISFTKTLEKIGIKVENLLAYSSPAYEIKIEMACRILAQDANLYGNIQIQNPLSSKYVKLLLESSEELQKILENKDLNEFTKYFNKSQKFLGKYAPQALKESDYLIAKLREKNLQTQNEVIKNKKAEIALLGPKYTHSDIACNSWLKKTNKSYPNISKIYCQSISEIFELVKKKQVKKGFVPLENMIDGSIQETQDNLFKHQMKILEEVSAPIHHCIATTYSTIAKDINQIFSHEKAINQCSDYIKKYCPKAQIIKLSSTAQAMRKLAFEKFPNSAAIGTKSAAKALNLEVLDTCIENKVSNRTHFIVISNKESKNPHKNLKLKTAIAFYFGENKPGQLHQIFSDFATNKINLSLIESRPSKKEYGDYVFFLNFDGHQDDANAKSVLKNIKKNTAKLMIFGSFPIVKV